MKTPDLLTAALMWYGWGCPVLPVIFRPKKNGHGTDKIPLVEFDHWKSGAARQTVEDIRGMTDQYGNPAWERAEGVAILLWPTTDRIILDVDDLGRKDQGDRLLAEAGITLPPTGVMHTPSGGRHYHLTVPPGPPHPDPNAPDRDKRAIRLLHATDRNGKPCKPAVDLLLNGIAVVAGPGYREDPDNAVDPANLASIPESILALARAKRSGDHACTPSGASAGAYADLLRGVPLGIQHDTSVRLIGHLLPKLGLDETWTIMADWCDRCTPPADKKKVRANFEDIAQKDRARGNGTRRTLWLVTATDLLARDYSDRVDIVGGGILTPEGGLILAGPSGAGKSLLSLELALDLANGTPALGLFTVAGPQHVLMIQQENSQAQVQGRLAKMTAARGLTVLAGGLMFNEPGEFLDLEDDADWDAIRRAIEETHATVVILDPLSTFHSRDENDNTRMRKVLDRVTAANRVAHCAAIVIHHFGKPQAGQSGDETRHAIRGASSILDWADTAITLTEKRHEELILRRLEFVKVRNGKPIRPLLLKRDPETLLHTVEQEEGVLCDPLRVKAILRDLGGEVDSKSALVSEIMKVTGASQATAYRVVDQAIAGKLIREAPGEGKRVRLEVA